MYILKSTINMYLFDMTNEIPHVRSFLHTTSEKTRDPDQMEVQGRTQGVAEGALPPPPPNTQTYTGKPKLKL